ncbi:MAG: tetratricopeptide repeat protein [Myxococcales bacterium]|nr:tetratricopeptide repeat protein [Myxococcales bacterium]
MERARGLGHAPTLAAALLQHGRLLGHVGDGERATAALVEAAALADEHAVDDVVADAYKRLILVAATATPDARDGLRWAALARARIARIGERGRGRDGTALERLGITYTQLARYEEAEAALREALEILTEVYGERDFRVASARTNLAGVLARRGEPRAAIELAEGAHALLQELQGPWNPKAATRLGSLAGMYAKTGDMARARALYGEALARLDAAGRGESSEAARVLVPMAWHEQSAGNTPAAIELGERATRLYDGPLAAESADEERARAHETLAWSLITAGEHARASEALRHALAALERAGDVDPKRMAKHWSALADQEAALARHDEEADAYRRAVVYLRAAGDAVDGESVAATMQLEAAALLRAEDPRAVEVAAAALSLHRAPPTSHVVHIARSEWLLARALTQRGQEPERARALARSALATFEERDSDSSRAAAAEIRAWLTSP